MIISYRWLSRLLGRELPLADVLERLTMAGLEVEGVTDLGVASGKVISAIILDKIPHPNADSLVLCQVDAGGPAPFKIVCGAKNMGPGDMVPLSIEGAKLPNGLVIKKSKIRGESSDGMMCSGKELGWGDDADGLLILPQDWVYEKGKPFDALIDIKVTPNRPDCLSLFGVARDIAAALGLGEVAFPDCAVKETGPAAKDFVTLRIDAPEACPRYTGRVVRGVEIAPSPLWLRRAVESAGLRSINNVVDVTNYLLMELGHPIHAFDLDKIEGKQIIVRIAADGEQVVTLDGQTCDLNSADLVIADANRPVALAGIMGCGNTEITDATTNVFIECAYFAPTVVRKTSKRLAKSTDSSYRFERGTDWSALPKIVDRAAKLIAEVAGGQICAGAFDEGPGVAPAAPIVVDVARVNSLLGLSLKADEMIVPLRALGFTVEGNSTGHFKVTPPAFRPDIEQEADIVEEVGRLIGYDKIPTVRPAIESRPGSQPREDQLSTYLRDSLVRHGFSEVANFSFLSADAVDRSGYDSAGALKLRNPLSAEFAVMRPGILPGLLQTVLYNQNRGATELRLFEIGTVYQNATKPADMESTQFAAVVYGTLDTTSWRGAAKTADFFDGKAIADALLEGLGAADYETVGIAEAAGSLPVAKLFHPGKSAALRRAGKILLRVGELHPGLRQTLDIKRNVVVILGEFDALLPLVGALPKIADIPVFPAVSRDLALVAGREVPAADIESAIAKRAKSLLAGIQLFDVYEGDKIAADKRSLAYRILFSAGDRTLTDDEVNQLQEKILADLKAKLGVELRS
ncbi:MAG: phenylalanine--tRNA ligase subunit beta [Candidatus Sumerlaeaceae bacterium]|nr:phenylalanine--tRNA ligase subunit beta [Candidatus Sumerlaeaceae bacterium]